MPAILLARMAVDSRHKGHGLGAALLKHFMLKAFEVAQSVGVRVLLIRAKNDEAKSFYSHYGFVESRMDPLVLMRLLRDLDQRLDFGAEVLTATGTYPVSSKES
jgi:GNAT superfamily N-acetyltransferase